MTAIKSATVMEPAAGRKKIGHANVQTSAGPVKNATNVVVVIPGIIARTRIKA